ncbi:MAG: hypothetical protein AAGA35_03790 [Patescibacteria group bacterium]
MRLVHSAWSLLLCAIVLISAGASSAFAEQSERPEWRHWTVQHAQAFKPTPEHIRLQLRKMDVPAAEQDLIVEGIQAVQAGQSNQYCKEAISTPGTRYSELGMNPPGQQARIAYKQEQQLGRTVPVVQCTVGGRTYDWFNEPIEGCNNLGRRYVAVVTPPRVEERSVCKPSNSYVVYEGVSAEGFHCGKCYTSGFSTKRFVDGGQGQTCTGGYEGS